MRTVGIDSSSHTGMALVGDGLDRGKVIEFKNQRGFLRLQLIAGEVERTLDVWNPDFVVMESYAFCRNVNSFITLVECGTVIKQVLHRRKLKWAEVTPTALKKWTSGTGTASKDGMAEAVKKWGFTSHSHDIVDAFALAQMGQLGIARLGEMNGVRIL